MISNSEENNQQENKKLTTVTNLSIQRKRLRELANYFSSNSEISIKPAELTEWETFIVYTKNMSLDNLFGLNDLNFRIVSIKKLGNAYQIILYKEAREKGNSYSKERNNHVSELYAKYDNIFDSNSDLENLGEHIIFPFK